MDLTNHRFRRIDEPHQAICVVCNAPHPEASHVAIEGVSVTIGKSCIERAAKALKHGVA